MTRPLDERRPEPQRLWQELKRLLGPAIDRVETGPIVDDISQIFWRHVGAPHRRQQILLELERREPSPALEVEGGDLVAGVP